MIVLDEELQGLGLEATISQWYRGAVILIKHLRPGTVIKDEAIPALLRHVKSATFVTINYRDFWRRLPAEQACCCGEPVGRSRRLGGGTRPEV